MIIEILIVLLIIIVLLVFLLFIKTWNIHILFKNHNLDYILSLKINFLFIQVLVDKITDDTKIIISLNIFSHTKQLLVFNYNSNDNLGDESEESIESQEKALDDDEDQEQDGLNISKIKEISTLLIDSKEDLWEIIKLAASIIKFKNSYVELNMGLGDNNLTIKVCNLLWALSAPLSPLHFQLILTPRINEVLLISDCNILFHIKLFNLLKITYIIFRNKNLRKIIKIIR